MTKYQIVASIILFAAGFASHYALVSNVQTYQNTSNSVTEHQVYISKIDMLNNQITELHGQLKDLKHQKNNFTIPDKSPADLSSTNQVISASQNTDYHEQQELKNLQAFKVEHQTEDFLKWYNAANKNNSNGVQIEMDQKFLNEVTDYSWATERENKLNTLFSSNDQLTEFSIVENDCKSTLCRISIITPDSSRATQLSNSLSQELYKNGTENDFGSFITVVEPNSGLTYVYVSRDEESFQSILESPLKNANYIEKSN